MMKRTKWTKKEEKILIDNCGLKSIKELCEILSNRTSSSIRHKVSKLKLSLCKCLDERFWYFVDKKSNKECWEWTGSFYTSKCGYGRFSFSYNKKQYNMLAHRVSYIIHNDNRSLGKLFVCHSCDNPKCVNPNHLFLGDHKKNMKDMILKNRQAKGESHGNHKLTIDQVKQIKNLKGQFLLREIAEMFNVCLSTISYIHSNKTWR